MKSLNDIVFLIIIIILKLNIKMEKLEWKLSKLKYISF